MKPSHDVLSQKLGDETVLVHLGTNRFYSLNSTGGKVWEMLTAGQRLDEIRARLAHEYGRDEAEVAGEMETLIRLLRDERLVVDDGSG